MDVINVAITEDTNTIDSNSINSNLIDTNSVEHTNPIDTNFIDANTLGTNSIVTDSPDTHTYSEEANSIVTNLVNTYSVDTTNTLDTNSKNSVLVNTESKDTYTVNTNSVDINPVYTNSIESNSIDSFIDNKYFEYIKEKIKEDIKNNNINNILTDSLISNIINEKKDLIIKEETENVIYQITSTENQKNNKNNNLSSLYLGNCENILKSVYNIKDPIIIYKIDYFKPDSLIPIIGYELYHPNNKTKLDLRYCKDEFINLNIPVSIDEGILFKYDPNSDYYTDECSSYTTEDGTDILLSDRQEEFNENNMSLCENICNYVGYKSNTKEARCLCSIKPQQIVISDIINQPDILTYNNFTEKTLSSNMMSMKCFDTLF